VDTDIPSLRKPADAGDATAQFKLGYAYASGRGVPQDYSQAVVWYGKAANQGVADAQSNLGVMYRDGQGVPQDDGQAVGWTRKAADQGFAEAQSNLGVMYDYGQGAPQDDAQSVAWTRRAVDQGLAEAMYNLGDKYRYGQGVPQDYVEAYKWLTLAASRASAGKQKEVLAANGQYVPVFGSKKDYADARDIVAKSMTPQQLADARQRANEWTAAFEKRTNRIGLSRRQRSTTAAGR
jgi:hypothetical protein